MPDWKAMKLEYITGGLSYRNLAKKYGIPYQAIAKHGKDDGWGAAKTKYNDELMTKTIEKIGDDASERLRKLLEAADKIVFKSIKMLDQEDLDAKDLRSISGALKDAKDIQMIRSDMDRREQEARINALNAKVTAVDDDGESGVVLLPEVVDDG